MKRLGENVFRFGYSVSGKIAGDWLIAHVPLLVALLFVFAGINEKVIGALLMGLLMGIISVYWRVVFWRYIKDGVVIDHDRAVVIRHKWTWNPLGKSNFEEIPMGEIMGTQQDINVTTTTSYSSGKWNTSESRKHNIVLQGKFGSRRFSLQGQDDWNLFMTLLYGEQ